MKKAHPPTWWFRLAQRMVPTRCREIPEVISSQPGNREVVLLRQVAIVKERLYLQQFASGEHSAYFHSHPWIGGTVALGLWGQVTDRLLAPARPAKRVRAPYLRVMGPGHVHQTQDPSPGHTSLFLGLGHKTDRKYYVRESSLIHWRHMVGRLVARM